MPLQSTLTEADIAAIAAMHEPFTAAMLARDWDSFLALYTEDTVVMPPHSPALVGRAAIREWAEALPPVTAFVGTIDEVAGHGDMAFVRGRFEMTLDIPGVPEPVTDVGSFIEIRERHPDGRWLLARDIFNSDLPAPE